MSRTASLVSAPRARVRRVLGAGVLLAALGVFFVHRAGLSLQGAVARPSSAASGDIDPSIAGVARTWIADHPAEQLPFMWGEGVLMLGLDCAAQRLRERDQSAAAAIDRYVRSYYDAHAERGTAFTWSDQLTPAIAAATRLARGEGARRRVVDDAVHYALHAPRTATYGAITHFGRSPLRYLAPPFPDAWVDSLFHVVPLLVRHARLAGAPHELDEAAEQLVRFMRVVQDPSSGLVTHAFSEREGVAVPEPAFTAHAFWLRGQGWVLASGVEAWAALSAAHPLRGELAARVQRLARAVIARQARSGLFHTLVTRADTYEETAGSALVVYALERGVTAELFEGPLDDQARSAAARGLRGLLAIVDRDGERYEITGTSLGTNPWPAIYAYVPTAPQVSYGVGAWLLATCERPLEVEVRN